MLTPRNITPAEERVDLAIGDLGGFAPRPNLSARLFVLSHCRPGRLLVRGPGRASMTYGPEVKGHSALSWVAFETNCRKFSD
jgi:hypothetical protein